VELLASQDESQEEDDGHQAPAEDEEEPATVELVLEGEHEEDEPRRGHTRVWVLTVMRSFPSHRPPRRTTMTIQPSSSGSCRHGLHPGWRMMQHPPPPRVEDDAASATEEEDWEEDNGRSERLFGYDPDRDVDVWDEYQAAMEDPMFAY
jgi:hypothetical protein